MINQIMDDGEIREFIDVDGGLKRLVNNKKLYTTLLKSFKGMEIADEISDALKQKDYDAAAGAAHKIKGVSANLSLVKLYEESAAIESNLKEGTQLEVLPDKYLDVVNKTQIAIDSYTRQR